MAWISIEDDFINLDNVTFVDFHESMEGVVVEFHKDENTVVLVYRMSKESAEKLKKALYYATKAVPVHIEAPSTV